MNFVIIVVIPVAVFVCAFITRITVNPRHYCKSRPLCGVTPRDFIEKGQEFNYDKAWWSWKIMVSSVCGDITIGGTGILLPEVK